MTGYSVEITCPACGGPLLHINGSEHIEEPDLTRSDARCDTCCNVFRFTVTATMIEAWPVDRTTAEARQTRARAAAIESAVPAAGESSWVLS